MAKKNEKNIKDKTSFTKKFKAELKKVKKGIESVGGKILGTCINCVPIKSSKQDSKYYYYNEEKKTNSPRITGGTSEESGLIPIKYNGTNWVVCSETDKEWYSNVC